MMRIVPAGVDLLLVLVFAVIGRLSHGLDPLAVLETAWPFLVACLFGWVVLNLLDDDGYGPRAALVIWLVTLLAGLGLRIISGGGAAPAFVLVTAGVLAALLAGWRLVAWLLRRRRNPQSSTAASVA